MERHRRSNKGRGAARIVFGVVLALAVASALGTSTSRSDLQIVSIEAHRLYEALDSYYERNHPSPDSRVDPRLELGLLQPLVRRGYSRGGVMAMLLHDRPDSYESPDDRGPSSEFWIEMTLASDPSVRVLVVRSDDAPLGGGDWLDGVYVYRDGTLEPI